MNDHENIPARIFDWIQEYPFEKLSPAQKAEVLKHLDEQTYADMHQASQALAQVKAIPPAKGKTDKKQLLLDRYDAQRKQGTMIPIWRKSVALWKAAAVIVFLLGSFYVYTAARNENPVEYVAQVDTVYVTKEIPAEPIKIHDTVYVIKHSSSKQKADPSNVRAVNNNGGMTVNGTDNMGTVPMETLENRSNQPKRNSMKDDTLWRKYSFVTL